MRSNADRSHSWSAAAVWNTECLVQIEMANVCANLARSHQPNERIEIRSVHIDLTAMLMHDFAEFANAFFEDAVGARIGDHARCQILRMLVCLRAQICEINIALIVALDRHNIHSRNNRTCGIRAVRTLWNEARSAMTFAATLMERTDRH